MPAAASTKAFTILGLSSFQPSSVQVSLSFTFSSINRVMSLSTTVLFILIWIRKQGILLKWLIMFGHGWLVTNNPIPGFCDAILIHFSMAGRSFSEHSSNPSVKKWTRLKHETIPSKDCASSSFELVSLMFSELGIRYESFLHSWSITERRNAS
jgi:hypothetical protein